MSGKYPDWKEGADLGDRVAFDLGYSYAMLHRAVGLLELVRDNVNLAPGVREELSELLGALSDFEAKRLQVRDQVYAGALALGEREANCRELYPDGPGASPEELSREREKGALLGKMKELLEAGTYLIWSFEHEAWWGPGQNGYVQERGEAGVYSLVEAKAICLEASRHGGPDIKEAMVPLELAKLQGT